MFYFLFILPHTVAPRFGPGLVGARLIPPFPAETRRKPTCFSEVVLVSFYVYRGIGESRGSQSRDRLTWRSFLSGKLSAGAFRAPVAIGSAYRPWNYAGTTGINEERDGERGGERAVTESSGAKILSPPPEYVLEVATFMYTE